MTFFFDYVDLTDSNFVTAVLCIAFNPLFWNLKPYEKATCQIGESLGPEGGKESIPFKMGRWEHKTRSLTRIFRSPYVACYCLGATILFLNFLRSHCFTEVMKSQPKLKLLDCLLGYYIGMALIAVGSIFVISSFLALGFFGTFLGDYFGILMEAKVTCFPFSILDNPMYWGSTTVYLGWSLMHASPTGLVLTAVVALCYRIALLYEGPFTEEIYRQKPTKSK
ncbi:phosphatidylethanolamine N-methyltransferase isoform X3 [Sceloporus undulatus]|nr:phosphatidylethanolamine N-methyltransferase isoform X3 [Sceloporus undulatus]XP_042293848.1 phosphatidylethanolamine N-methyltransferase isoform X3 [Sceloporus undulatus]XP_042293849.1 phosphatidylethanolamine N-methyltransferase isoform X3 [Sceloporus undulatus]XP_042293850.1 phosphatidylethanolamine N-methyltransferase isoform X3 [Sceloporus undulatus]